MTKEEKQLLLIDLCARLNCGVIIKSDEYEKANYRKHYPQKLCGIQILSGKITCIDVDDYPDPMMRDWKIELCKPYLRPMSSMTEEEKQHYRFLMREMELYGTHGTKLNDWLNECKFDHRGLISKGLALPAKDGMYN